MIDMLVLHIPFLEKFCTCSEGRNGDYHFSVDVKSLPNNINLASTDITRDDKGVIDIGELRTVFESLPSSFSGMAMKIYNEGMNSGPFVAIKCSPAKLLQGHNLYGFDDVKKSAFNMLGLLATTYPDLYSMLNIPDSVVSELDITYSIFIKNEKHKLLFLDHLRNVSAGHTKNHGDNFQTTIYFGAKNSRLKKLKVYSKFEEMQTQIPKLLKNGYNDSAKIVGDLIETDYAKTAIRFESTLKKRFLERRGINCNLFAFIQFCESDDFILRELWAISWKDILKALKGQELKIMNNESVFKSISSVFTTYTKSNTISLVKVNRLYAFYISIQSLGFNVVKSQTNSRTFSRNVSDLCSCGISRSVLQNLTDDNSCVVLPFSVIIDVDFTVQTPIGYVSPPDLFMVA